MPDDVEYLNLQEAAEELGVTRRRVWQMVKSGQIESVANPLDRREKLIARSEVERFRPFVRPAK